MSKQPRPCAHCGEPMQPGHPKKRVHAECVAPYRAEKKRAKRKADIAAEAKQRGLTPAQVEAERRARQKDGSPHFWRGLVRADMLRGGGFVGTVMGAPAGDDAPRIRGRRQTAPEGQAWGETRGEIVGRVPALPPDWQPAPPASFWRHAAYQIALAASSTTARAAWTIWNVLRDHGAGAALRHFAEILDEPEQASVAMRIEEIEEHVAVDIEAAGHAALKLYDRTGDVRIIEALAQVPGFRGVNVSAAASRGRG